LLFSEGGAEYDGMIQSLMMLALEANHVIGLRLMKQMRGAKRARRESQLMINENIDAAFKAGASMMAGGSAAKVVQGYRRRVAANAKRLSRSGLCLGESGANANSVD
jgi:hypothetical protein